MFTRSRVNDNEVMAFVEERFERALRGATEAAHITALVRRPPKPVALGVLFGEHQQYLLEGSVLHYILPVILLWYIVPVILLYTTCDTIIY